jgi:capsular polysaccharide biosynthesis protein
MSKDAKDRRRSGRFVLRRHKVIIGVLTVLGLLGGAAYSVVRPPAVTSTALVVLPQAAPSTLLPGETGPDQYMATQVVIVTSNPVLSSALARLGPATSPAALRSEVQVKSPTPNILSISAKGTSAAQAEARANAVATSYVAYITSPHNAYGPVSAHILNQATSATGNTSERRIIYALLGAIAGVLLGLIAAFGIGRRDRRLFRRDELAIALGVPVLASFPVLHPADAAGWTRLLENYNPGDLYGWRLRHALQELGMPSANGHNGSGGRGASIAVVSLSFDSRALALGPQLAAYAASLGIPTALVIGPHEDTTGTATLRTACVAPVSEGSKQSGYLRVGVADRGDAGGQRNAVLTVVVVVVDSQNPQVGGTMSTTATVIGVSAGAATAEQLARVATSAADDGREIAGILVADPEPTDKTTGRIPQPPRLPRPHQQQQQRSSPPRAKDTVTEIRRLTAQAAVSRPDGMGDGASGRSGRRGQAS